jgi:hypothetical protein
MEREEETEKERDKEREREAKKDNGRVIEREKERN